MPRRLRILLLLAAIFDLSGCASHKTNLGTTAGAADTAIYNADVQPNALLYKAKQEPPFIEDIHPSECKADETMLTTPEKIRALKRAWIPHYSFSPGLKFRPVDAVAYPQRMIFPKQAWSKGLRSGSVTLAMFIDSDGNLSSILPLCASDPVFVEPAIEAAHRYRFRPAAWGKWPVHAMAIQRFVFNTSPH